MESGCPNSSNQNQNQTGDKQITLTNTDCVLKNWRVYESLWDTATTQVYVHVENKVHKHVKWEVDEQVHLQVKWEVDAQPNPFKTKIKQEINK